MKKMSWFKKLFQRKPTVENSSTDTYKEKLRRSTKDRYKEKLKISSQDSSKEKLKKCICSNCNKIFKPKTKGHRSVDCAETLCENCEKFGDDKQTNNQNQRMAQDKPSQEDLKSSEKPSSVNKFRKNSKNEDKNELVIFDKCISHCKKSKKSRPQTCLKGCPNPCNILPDKTADEKHVNTVDKKPVETAEYSTKTTHDSDCPIKLGDCKPTVSDQPRKKKNPCDSFCKNKNKESKKVSKEASPKRPTNFIKCDKSDKDKKWSINPARAVKGCESSDFICDSERLSRTASTLSVSLRTAVSISDKSCKSMKKNITSNSINPRKPVRGCKPCKPCPIEDYNKIRDDDVRKNVRRRNIAYSINPRRAVRGCRDSICGDSNSEKSKSYSINPRKVVRGCKGSIGWTPYSRQSNRYNSNPQTDDKCCKYNLGLRKSSTYSINARKAVRGCNGAACRAPGPRKSSSYSINPRKAVRGCTSSAVCDPCKSKSKISSGSRSRTPSKCSIRSQQNTRSCTSCSPKNGCTKCVKKVRSKKINGGSIRNKNCKTGCDCHFCDKRNLDRHCSRQGYTESGCKKDFDSIKSASDTYETISNTSTPTIIRYFKYKSGFCHGARVKKCPSVKTVSSTRLQKCKNKPKMSNSSNCCPKKCPTHKRETKNFTECGNLTYCPSQYTKSKSFKHVCIGHSVRDVTFQCCSKATSYPAKRRNCPAKIPTSPVKKPSCPPKRPKKCMKSKKCCKTNVTRGIQYRCPGKCDPCSEKVQKYRDPVIIFAPPELCLPCYV